MPPAAHSDPAWLTSVAAAFPASADDGNTVVVAASGGADSTALAWAVARLRGTMPRPPVLHLVHCDHGQHAFRHRAAEAVSALGRVLGCPVQTVDLGLTAGASEQRMREARYEALGAAATALGASVVLTAHHADDQIETIVMRAARGTGRRGLAGIPRRRQLLPGVHLLRPLLDVRREELHRLVHATELPFVEDPTNAALDKTRNRTRHVLLPQLRSERPGFDTRVLTAARRIAARANRVQAAAHAWLAPHLGHAHPTRLELRELPPAGPVGQEAIRLAHVALTGSAPLSSWVLRVEALAGSPPATCVDAAVGCHLRVERTRNGLLFLDPRAESPSRMVPVAADGSATAFGAACWSVTLGPTPRGPAAEPFDADAAPGPYHLRRPRPGDRVLQHRAPTGGTRSLRRLLAAAGVPLADRATMPLLCDAGDRIVWAPGLGVSPFARTGLATRRFLHAELAPSRVGIDLHLPAY